MYSKNAELKAGIVVLSATIALFALLFVATGGAIWGSWRHVHLRIEPGDLAPKVGDAVQMNGVDVGRVEDVRLAQEVREEDGPGGKTQVREVYVAVVAKLESDRVLPKGTDGVMMELLTGSRVLALVPGRSTENLSDADTAANPIFIKQAPNLSSITERISKVADQAEAIAHDVSGVAKSANLLLDDARGLVDAARKKVDAVDVAAITADVGKAAASMRRTLEALESSIGGIAGDLASAAADAKRLAAAGAALGEGAQKDVASLLARLNAVAGKIDQLVDRVSPKVDAFADDLQRMGANLARVSEELSGVGPDARALLRSVGGDVDELSKVLVDTAHNLLDASEDVRTHPWKLLNVPSNDEIAYENLRSAMTNYVRAMREMESTSGQIRDILASGGSDPETQATLRRTLAEFEASRDRVHRMEARLLQLLQASSPPAAPGGR
jgi:ABC-type transporter Mla subunit MlaD